MSVAGFTKLWSTIIHSTIWDEAPHIKVVWITMLAMADRNGTVCASIPGLANASRVTREQCDEALERLSSPDPDSRTQEYDGRRIEAIDGGWRILNYLKYRERRDEEERRIQTREAVRRHRAKKATGITVSQGKPRKAHAEADAEAEVRKTPTESSARSAGGPASEPAAEVPSFVLVGGKEWRLSAAKLHEYRGTFPDLNVVAELRESAQWTRDNPAKRKTERGMHRFCFAWLERSQNRGHGHKPEPVHPTRRRLGGGS